MEIPLTLRRRKDGSLTYGIPLWYRVMSIGIVAIVIAGLLSSGESPGIVSWIILLLLALGVLYEERWVIDPNARTIAHYAGILPIAKSYKIPMDSIASIGLEALIRGTVPGSKEEADEKAKAFKLMRGSANLELGHGLRFLGSGRKRLYISLVMRLKDGSGYRLDAVQARTASRLLATGNAVASLCGVPFLEGE